MKKVLDISVDLAIKKICAPTTPIFLINDILSNMTIDDCSNIFAYLEDNSNVWKSELFYSSVRNYLLRMCNGDWTIDKKRLRVFIGLLFLLRFTQALVEISKHSIYWKNSFIFGKIVSIERKIWSKFNESFLWKYNSLHDNCRCFWKGIGMSQIFFFFQTWDWPFSIKNKSRSESMDFDDGEIDDTINATKTQK